MSIHGYSDDKFINDDENVTLISKLDVSNPLHLHRNDSAALTIVSVKLKGTENYHVWSNAMLLALEGRNKTGFIVDLRRRYNVDDGSVGRQWDRVNAVVLGARHVWEELKETYDKVDGFVTFNLHHKIHTLKQNGSTLADYYHSLNALWKQFDCLIELPRCTCHAADDFKKHNQLMKLMQFLMGLDDSYMSIRSSILSKDTLPDVRNAYATISSEESHRGIYSSMSGSSQRSQTAAFASNVPNRTNFQRGQTSNNNSRPISANNTGPRPNNANMNRQSGGSGLVCENCGFNSQNFKGISVSNHSACMRANVSDGLTDETTLSLLISPYQGQFYLLGKMCQANIVQNDGTNDIPDSGIDADISDHFHATQDEQVTTLEENIMSEGNEDINPMTNSQGTQNLRRSFRQSVFRKNYNDFVVESKVKYGLEKFVGYANLNTENLCFVTELNKSHEPKTFSEALRYSHWIGMLLNKEFG
ncbi:ribonuclease H-like domain-containing protein [Tanacetum coccineum]|uniref:Ribonuclease H-like domain-containing protein n=1 Tax=Tanacetum coccineum TaxID=301880 RepID=A0ABQ4XBP1_9ASTR